MVIKPEGMTLLKQLDIPCQKLPDGYDMSQFGHVMFNGLKLGLIPNEGVEILKITSRQTKDYVFFMFIYEDRNEAQFFAYSKITQILTHLNRDGALPGWFRWMCQKHLEWSNYMEEKETEMALAKIHREAERKNRQHMKQQAKG